METKTLSDKEMPLGSLMGATCGTKIYYPEDVKEFIKDILDCANYEDDWATRDYIKKRAGDKLI